MIFNIFGNIAKNGNIVIRKFRSKDFVFFKDWYKADHVKKEVRDTISDKEIKSMISIEKRIFKILIIENEEKPIGMIKIYRR